jgi:translation initiation factor 1A
MQSRHIGQRTQARQDDLLLQRICGLLFEPYSNRTPTAMPPKRGKYRGPPASKEILFKDDDQQYAHVIKALGDRRFSVLTDEGAEVVAKLRGNMRRQDFVSPGCVVLCSVRSDNGRKADILHKYTDQHTKLLRRYGELEQLFAHVATYNKDNTISTRGVEEDDDLVCFEEDDIDDMIDHL